MGTADPNAILSGGTARTLPIDRRIRRVENLDDTFKLFTGDRYAHFVPSADTELHDGRLLRVFTWVRDTYVAE
ncbi:DUF5988 family protein [Streptomyces sp. NPDC054933]